MKRFLFFVLCTLFLVSCKQSYKAQIEYGDGSVQEVSFSAANDSLANVYGFQKFVDALNYFEQTEGNKEDLKAIDYKKKPKSVLVFKEEGNVNVTNITPEIEEVCMKAYVPSPLRMAAERAEKERIDSLASYVWGDLKFGMSKSEVETMPLFNPLKYSGSFSVDYSDYEDKFLVPSEYNQLISEKLELELTPILSLIFTGKDGKELIAVKLETDYNQYGTGYGFVMDCKKLVSLISAKYGEEYVTKSNLKYLKKLQYDNSTSTIARWEVGHKTITLSLYISNNKRRYSLDIKNDQYPHKNVKVPVNML